MVIATTVLILIQVVGVLQRVRRQCFGPRYLAPALPFIGLAAAYGIKRGRSLGWS